jgi:hypothetical protein
VHASTFTFDGVSVRFHLFLTTALLLLLPSGCSGPKPGREGVISRDAFFQAYYGLRMAALRSPGIQISLEARDSVLDALGLTEDDLLDFADAWGEDSEMMLGIWEEVDSLMREERLQWGIEEEEEGPARLEELEPDTAGGGSS